MLPYLQSAMGIEEELVEDGVHDGSVDDDAWLHVLLHRPVARVDLKPGRWS